MPIIRSGNLDQEPRGKVITGGIPFLLISLSMIASERVGMALLQGEEIRFLQPFFHTSGPLGRLSNCLVTALCVFNI